MNTPPDPQRVLYAERLKRLYELYPELVDFGQKTGEIALFKETLEGIYCALPKELQMDLLVIGWHLQQVLDIVIAGENPAFAAALNIMRAHKLRHHE
jgi:hypothetical protein